jgi:hypothetical protein
MPAPLMSLAAGTRLGPYEILAPIGAGGMGEVYRASDTKLNRDVALKILPEAFATDPDRLARFRREAQVLASLNHPNIGHIYGFEDSGATHALVMELVEGPTLADRIALGPIPLADALPIARQIADALEAAHDSGVIHRDLKPANIKVRDDGTVKVLDFGLAKTADAATSGVDAASSPTLTARATQMGMILGTAAYMAPEQARGKAVDRRADIWAFGVVLYEMLTGRRAFEGEEISDVLAAVLRQDIDWNALPPATPRPLRRLLERCLNRDVKARLRDIGEARVAIEQLVGGASEEVAAAPPTGAPRPATSMRALVLTSVTTALVVAAAAWTLLRPVGTTPSLVQAMIPMPAGLSLASGTVQSVAVSATHVAFVAGSNAQLFVRALAGVEATPVPGTTGVEVPFFSPDGQWLAFFVPKDKRLKKVPVAGGPVSDLCEALQPNGADWGPAGIVFADYAKGIFTVSGDGSTPQLVIARNKDAVLVWPSWLPGGRAILYTEAGRIGTGTFDLNGAKVRALSLDAGATPTSVVDGYAGRFVPPHSLAFERDGTLLGMRFDSSTRTASGGIETLFSDAAGYSVSPSGTLVFPPVGGAQVQRTYVWVDRQHHVEPTGIPPQSFWYPRISPDGTRIVIASASADRDLWIWDLRQRALTRLTTERGADSYPVWTPDGRRVIYAGAVHGTDENLVMRAADGTGGVEVLLNSDRHQTPYTMSPDGEFVVFRDEVPGHGTDLGILRMSTREAKPLIATPFNERDAEISPDGRLIAYQSNETGKMEIYVRPFPNVDAGKKMVSSGGGIRPCWSRDGRQLFYLTASGPPATMNGVERRAGGLLDFGPPEVIFDVAPYSSSTLLGRTYDVAADGRFLMPSDASTGSASAFPGVSLVLNWAQHLSANR